MARLAHNGPDNCANRAIVSHAAAAFRLGYNFLKLLSISLL
jgi:hypothetical protein